MVPRNSIYGNYRLKIEYLTGSGKTEYADSKGEELKTLLIFRKYNKRRYFNIYPFTEAENV
jgi:hypothetical protein